MSWIPGRGRRGYSRVAGSSGQVLEFPEAPLGVLGDDLQVTLISAIRNYQAVLEEFEGGEILLDRVEQAYLDFRPNEFDSQATIQTLTEVYYEVRELKDEVSRMASRMRAYLRVVSTQMGDFPVFDTEDIVFTMSMFRGISLQPILHREAYTFPWITEATNYYGRVARLMTEHNLAVKRTRREMRL